MRQHNKLINKKIDFRNQNWKNQMTFGLRPFAWMFCMIYSKDWKMFITSDSFFFKTKFLTVYYWIDTIEKQNTFSSFVWLEIILPILLFCCKLFFFEALQMHLTFQFTWQIKSVTCREKMSLQTNLSLLITDLTYSIP